MTEAQSSCDGVLEEDLAYAVANPNIEWGCFDGCTILVTGATGYLGSVILKTLVRASVERGLQMRIIAFVRDLEKAERILGRLMRQEQVKCVLGDVNTPVQLDEHIDYIIHAAAVTTSKLMVEKPFETIATTLNGTQNMLMLAHQQAVRGMVFLSSMEVYGTPRDDYEMTEEKLGYINPLLPRSSYSESKRMAEGLCAAAAHEYGVPVKIARLAQTFGAGIPPNENRVFAQFARAILEGRDIVLRTDGSKSHCFCYTRDAVVGLLMLLTKGDAGEAYNLSNEDTFCSIRDMAEMLIASHPESGSKLVFDIPQDLASLGYPPSDKMKIISAKMRSLGWNPEIGLPEMFNRLLKSMKEI